MNPSIRRILGLSGISCRSAPVSSPQLGCLTFWGRSAISCRSVILLLAREFELLEIIGGHSSQAFKRLIESLHYGPGAFHADPESDPKSGVDVGCAIIHS